MADYKFTTDSTFKSASQLAGNEYILLNNKRSTTVNELNRKIRQTNWYTFLGIDFTFTAANKFTVSLDEETNFIYKEFALKFVQVNGLVTTTSYGFVTNIANLGGGIYEITFAGESTINYLLTNTTVYWLPEVNVVTVDVDLFNSDVFATATATDVLNTIQKTPRKIGGKIIYAEVTCFAEDTGTNSRILLKNGANTIATLSIDGTAYGTINTTGLTINPAYNSISGFLRIDTVNSGNKNSDGVNLLIKYLPLSLL